MTLSKTTKNHDEIRRWAVSRGAVPAEVHGTEQDSETSFLRFEFKAEGESLESRSSAGKSLSSKSSASHHGGTSKAHKTNVADVEGADDGVDDIDDVDDADEDEIDADQPQHSGNRSNDSGEERTINRRSSSSKKT